jgi:predicted nucleic acid-binding protein
VILIDSKILMYASGHEHPHRGPSLKFIERIAEGEIEATIDAEVLQEILHRYRSLDRWTEGGEVYDTARVLFPDVLPITAEVTDVARRLMDQYQGLFARDAIHSAVVEVYRLEGVCSFDRDFDVIRGLRRMQP